MHDIKQLAQDLKEHHRVQFQENGWDIVIQVRDEESANVYLSNHTDHGNMMVNGWYFFRPYKTVRKAIELANTSLSQLEEMRSSPDSWPQTERHIWHIRGCHTGHPNESSRMGCLFMLMPIFWLWRFING